MPKSLITGLLVSAVVALIGVGAIPPASRWERPPGWTSTPGGDGGRVLRVTTLHADGPGSLSEAVSASHARVVEFAVAGAIDLRGSTLKIARPFLTIAGETAPDPGITIVNGDISIATHDVVIRHIRVRSGDGSSIRKRGGAYDGISTAGGARDVIVDHCSISWASDENLTASGPRFQGEDAEAWRANTSHRITFSHNLVGEGISEGNTKGTLIHDNATEVLLYANLYVSHDDRHPLFKGGVRAAAVNNVIQNPGKRVMQFGFVPQQWQGREAQRAALAMVGNVARKGPDSVGQMVFFEVWPSYAPCDYYLEDNLLLDSTGAPLRAESAFRNRKSQLVPLEHGDEFRRVDRPPLWPPDLKALPSGRVVDWVLENVGARPWDRDATDIRFVREARSGTGRLIHFEGAARPAAPSR